MRNEKGFTLVEMLAVMIILGVIASIAAIKIMNFDSSASSKIVDNVIDELNTRDKLVWSNGKLTDATEPQMNTDFILGKAKVSGGPVVFTITVNGNPVSVYREPATGTTPAIWRRNE